MAYFTGDAVCRMGRGVRDNFHYPQSRGDHGVAGGYAAAFDVLLLLLTYDAGGVRQSD
jgi:hypothetical protein